MALRAFVLGRVRLVSDSGEAVALPSRRVGGLLRWFLLRPNETHSTDALIGALWPGDDSVARSRLQVVLGRLRRFLEAGGARAGGLAIVTGDGGHRLEADGTALDRVAFERLAERALGGEPGLATDALALWDGEPYTAITVSAEVHRQTARLVGLHRQLEEVRCRRAAPPSLQHHLARTKFLRPAVDTPRVVGRRRLLDLAGGVGDVAVLAVTAPAGFGKSVFLSQWAVSQRVPVGWVSLEPGDDDPARFWSAIFRGLATTDGLDVPAMPDAPPGSPRFVEALLDTLVAAATPVGLVLDDVHTIENSDLVGGFRRHLECFPGRLTLAIGTRDPAVLDWVGGSVDLRTVTADELRFAPDEMSEVMRLGGRGTRAAAVLQCRAEAEPLADVAEGTRRAARWCRRHGFEEQALAYALDGGEPGVVADLAGRVLSRAAVRGDAGAAARLLHDLDPAAVAGNPVGHDLVMLLVAFCLDAERREAWITSRAGVEGDDVMSLLVQSHHQQLRGCPRTAVSLTETALAASDSYFDRHRRPPGLQPLVEATLRISRACARMMLGAVGHDDGVLERLADETRDMPPAMSTWVLGEWAFLAYIRGDPELAARLVSDPRMAGATMDRRSMELGAPRALVASALVESDMSVDPRHQHRVGDRLAPVVPLYARLGRHTDVVPALLALQLIATRAGDLAAAARHAASADTMLALCRDAPLLAEARHRLGTGAAARPATGTGAAARPVAAGGPAAAPRRRPGRISAR